MLPLGVRRDKWKEFIVHSTARSVFVFRLGSCGVFNDEQPYLLKDSWLSCVNVNSCGMNNTAHTKACALTVWVYWSILVCALFFCLPYVYSVLHSTGNTGTSYKVPNVFIWSREDQLSVYLKTLTLKGQAKDSFCALISSCVDHFL